MPFVHVQPIDCPGVHVLDPSGPPHPANALESTTINVSEQRRIDRTIARVYSRRRERRSAVGLADGSSKTARTGNKSRWPRASTSHESDRVSHLHGRGDSLHDALTVGRCNQLHEPIERVRIGGMGKLSPRAGTLRNQTAYDRKMKVVVLGVTLSIAAISFVSGCDIPENPETRPESTSVGRAPPAKSAPSTLGSSRDVARHMTKDSGVHRIPSPDDAPKRARTDPFKSQIGNVVDVTAFYSEWMRSNKWTFDARNSTMDPVKGVSKSLGFTTAQIWCKRTSPITTVSILVGSGDATDHGNSVQIYIQNLQHEDSCP